MVNIIIYIISSVMHAFWLVLTYDLLEDRRIDEVIIKTNRFQAATCICSVIDHRGRQNVVRTNYYYITTQSKYCRDFIDNIVWNMNVYIL